MPFRHRAVRRVARAARHIGRAALRVGHRVASGGAAYLGTKAVSRAGRAASKYISRPPASRAPRVAHAKQGFRKFVAGVLHADPGTGADGIPQVICKLPVGIGQAAPARFRPLIAQRRHDGRAFVVGKRAVVRTIVDHGWPPFVTGHSGGAVGVTGGSEKPVGFGLK